jgi:hypothetical protein
MRTGHVMLGTRTRRLRFGVVAAAAVVLLAASAVGTTAAAAPAGPGAYGIVPGTGAFTLFSTNNLGGGSNQVVYLSTTGSGLHRLPFPLRFYNQSYNNVAVSTEFNVQLGLTSGAYAGDPASECVPNTTLGPSVMVAWSQIGTSVSGVFVRTAGTAPHRTFTIQWQGSYTISAEAPINAQVTFREDSQTITITYGTVTTETFLVVGVQSKQQLAYTEWFCNGEGRTPATGMQLKLVHVT